MVSLRREVGLLGLIFYGFGLIVGAGIYVLIGIASGLAGNMIWLSFLIGALLALFTGFSYAELSSLFPKESAEYVYAKKIFGKGIFPFLIGYIAIVSEIVGLSVVSLGFGRYLTSFIDIPPRISAILLISFLALINFKGITTSTFFNILLTIIGVSGLLLVVFAGIFHANWSSFNFFETPSLLNVFSASALIFFAFIGFEGVANIAEEAKNPRKIVPIALIGSILLSTFLYMLVGLSSVALVNYKTLATSNAPLSLVISKAFGNLGYLYLSFTALFSTASTALVLSVVNSRRIYGMSIYGELPKFLSKIHRKTRTPYIAVFLTALISIFFVLLEQIDIIAEIANFGILLVYASVNLNLIYLRKRYPKIKPSFKAPLNIKNQSILPFLGLATIFFLMIFLKPISLLIGLVTIILGIIFYYFLQSKKSKFAKLHSQ
ncbi:MAG: amino acid transporter [Candidatus Aenigmarchaeota archaeon ex4484_224]|nr:MAG: amino acid transporter [Candidatus Aenigmarchaeota archaeon ex4484_224]